MIAKPNVLHCTEIQRNWRAVVTDLNWPGPVANAHIINFHNVNEIVIADQASVLCARNVIIDRNRIAIIRKVDNDVWAT